MIILEIEVPFANLHGNVCIKHKNYSSSTSEAFSQHIAIQAAYRNEHSHDINHP